MGNLYRDLTKCKAVVVLIFIALINLPQCESRTVRVAEGERAILDFPYPCDTSEVALQHANARPFYRTANPLNVSLSSNQIVVHYTDSKINQYNRCLLILTIKHVSRNDQGTYIFTAYKNGVMLPDYKIYLGVDNLPGKAWCELSNDYNDRGWVSLLCTALVEPQTGHILCYQNSMGLPQMNDQTESDGQLSQVILASLDGLVYCCFSILTEMKDKCNCTDWGWDPMSDSVSDIADPCPQVMSTKDPTSTHIDNINSPSSNLVTTAPTKYPENHKKNSHRMKVGIALAIISIFAIIVIAVCLCHCKDHELTRLQCCNTQRNDPPSSENDVRLSENEEMIEL